MDLAGIQDELSKLTLDDSPTADILSLLAKIHDLGDSANISTFDLNASFLQLLRNAADEVKIQVAKCTAELTKTDAQREHFTNPPTMEMLAAEMDRIQSQTPTPDLDYLIQLCRATGNIIYDNDAAREILGSTQADATLLRLLDMDEKLRGRTAEELKVFGVVRCGLISNYIVGGDACTKRALELGIIGKITKILLACGADVERHVDGLKNVLMPLTILTETVCDLLFEEELIRVLVRIVAESTNLGLTEMCLELLHFQAEIGDAQKLLLAKEGLCEIIVKLLAQHLTQVTTPEVDSLVKLACEIIVLILTGDDSMHYLYKTSLVKSITEWLDSDNVELMSTGVLALGNFARTDSHCIAMVEDKLMHKMLDILSKNNGIDDDMRLQHALLSTLRNIVIPKVNKVAVVEAGLVQTILPMLKIHQPPVVFKLLGTLRMTVDGQEKLAIELLQNEELIKQLAHWSKSSEFANVTGESLRLMAWLIKHGYMNRKSDRDASPEATHQADAQSLEAFVRTDGAVECMVNMLTSQHLVMQNEALVALILLYSVIGINSAADGDSSLIAMLIKFELGDKMSVFVKKSADTMTKEIVENLQTFVALLGKSPELVAHLAQHNIDEVLKTIPILKEYCTL